MPQRSGSYASRLRQPVAIIAAIGLVVFSHGAGAQAQQPSQEWIPASEAADYPATDFYDPADPPPLAGTKPASDVQEAQLREKVEQAELVGPANPEFVPGHMWSDAIGIPDGFDKKAADYTEVAIAQQAQSTGFRSAAASCKSFWPAPNQVCGGILAKYEQLGGATSWLLVPLEPETLNPDGEGYRQRFVGGYIYWHPRTGAHAVANHTATVWERNGWEAGWLGYPVSDEQPVAGQGSLDGELRGWVQQFEGGRIYRSSVLQGFRLASINGLILEKWLSLGGPASNLGFPIADEKATSDGVGRFSVFQNGTIYWHPIHGAHPVMGAVHYKWNARGAETSEFGYPVGDPRINEVGLEEQDFENGILIANPDDVFLPFSCSAGAARVATEAALDQPYTYTCLPNGIYVDVPDGATHFSLPSIQDIFNPSDLFSSRSADSALAEDDNVNVCDLPQSKISEPIRRDAYRVAKNITICLGDLGTRGNTPWEQELSWELTNVLTQRLWAEVQLRLHNVSLPKYTFTVQTRVRQDLQNRPDTTVANPIITANGPIYSPVRKEYEMPKSAGTYFVEFTGMALNIDALHYKRAFNGPRFAIGRYNCDEYSDTVNTCSFPEIIDDHT